MKSLMLAALLLLIHPAFATEFSLCESIGTDLGNDSVTIRPFKNEMNVTGAELIYTGNSHFTTDKNNTFWIENARSLRFPDRTVRQVRDLMFTDPEVLVVLDKQLSEMGLSSFQLNCH